MLESVSFDDAKEISSPKNESQLQSVSFEDAQAIANPRNRNPLEVGEDAVRQLAISANNGLSMLVSYQAPDSPIVKYLDESNQRLQSGISDPTKQVLANANAKTVDAEKRGEVESFLTTLPEYIGQPALVQKFILENILGFVGPLAAGKAVQAASVWMKLFQGAGSAAKAADLGHAATAATGAIATGGDAYSDSYKQNKVYAVTELGMNEEDADAYALEQGKAARGVGTAIGAVSAGTGIEGRAFQGAAKGGIGAKIIAPVAKDMAGEVAEETIPPIATNLQTDQNWNKGLGQIAAQTIVGGSHASVGSAIVGANDYYKETVEEAPLGAPVTLPSKVMEASTVDEVISAAMEAVTPQSRPENNYATDEELIDQAAALQQPVIEPQQAAAPIQEPVIQPAPIATAPVVNQPAVDPVPSPVSQTPSLDPVQPAAPLLQPEKKVALQTEEPVLTKVEPAIQEAALKAESAASPVAPVTENIALPIAQATTKENITQTAPTTKINLAPAPLSENIAPVTAQEKKDIIPEANTGPSPEVLREETTSRITEFLNKKAGKVFQLLHARGKSGKTGGVVVAHDMEHAAELYAKATGKTLDEAKIHLLGDAKATDNGETQGFFDPGTKTTYLLANNLDEKSAPAVLHHELTHAVATPELLEQADNLLKSKLPNKNLQAFIKKVQKRRKDAGEENNREETASYIVEEALLHGKKNGFSKIDNTLFAHIADALGKQTGEFVRSWVAKARAHLFTKGVVTKLTVDDMLALVQARAAKVAKEAPKGSNKQEEGSNKPVLERVPEELYKEEPKVSKAKKQVEKLKKKDEEAPNAIDTGHKSISWTTGQDQAERYALGSGAVWTSKMYGDEEGLTEDGKPALIAQAANEIARKIGSLPVAKKDIYTTAGLESGMPEMEEEYPTLELTDSAIDKVKREGMPLFSKKVKSADDAKAIRRVAHVSPQGRARGNRQEDNAGNAPETRANPNEIAGPNAPIDSGHPLGSFVNIFTRNQLVKMYQNSPIGTLLKEYKRLREQTAADENHLYSEADDFLGQLRALPKSQRDKFATLAHEATLHGVDPSDPTYTPSANSVSLQQFVNSMQNAQNMSAAQTTLLANIVARLAGKEAKYNELRAKFEALPAKSQELFVGLRDQYKKSSTLLFTEAKNRIGRMRDIDATSKASAIEKLDKELNLLLGRVYFPLFRSGNHVVIATKPGEPKIVSYFETAKKADKEDKLLSEEGYTVTRDLRVVSGHAAKTGEALGKVIAQIDKAAASGSIEGQQLTALLDDINQTIIKSLPDQSFRKSFTHRKGTAGYSNDFIRAYADSMRRSSSHIANLKHSDEIQRNIAAMRDKIVKQAPGSKKQALTEVVNRVEQIEKEITIPTGKLASLAGRIGFTQMLGSISNFGLNLTQTPLNTFPHLGAEYGFTKAMLQLTSTMGKQIAVMKKPKSIREFSKFLDMRHDLSGTELAIFEQLHDAKKLDLTQAFDLIEAATNASENINDTWLNFMKFVALPQHTSEVINRQVTALATIRLEMARSGDSVKAYEAAKKAIDETHFDYSKDNRANIMTGNWLRVVTMFKQYAQNQMFLWGHTANLALTGSKEKDSDGNKLSATNKNTSERNKARKQLAAMFAAQMVAAGLLGLPVFSESAIVAAGVAGFKLKGEKGAYLGLGAGLLVALASSFGDDDEEDFDTLVRNWLSETFGEDLGEVIGKGTLPRGIAARLDGSEMIVRKPKHNENPYDYVADWSKAIMGAFIGGTMINAGVGTLQILNEDIKGGADKLLPLKQVKDMLQAYNWVKDDLKIKNTAGETVTEVTPMDVFWKALGINPSVAVRAREYDNAVRQLDAALTAKKQKTLKRLVEDLKDDPEQVAEEILAYNSEAPIGYKLTSSTIASEFRKETLKGTKLAGEPKDPKKKLTLEEKIKFYTPPPLTKEE